MATQKTNETNQDVVAYIEVNTKDQKLQDSLELLQIMQETTGFGAKMWGPSIIGFGKYHYKYTSGHEGETAIVGFSPRKAAISLYVFSGDEESKALVQKLGKFTMGKACIYVKKLTDIQKDILIQLIHNAVAFVKKNHTILP